MKEQPVYIKMMKDIIEKIKTGEYQPGQCLPSEREMCLEYDVSRMTVRHAINELRSEGYIYKIQGKGTFVSSYRIQQDLAKLTSFSYDMRMRGMKPGSKEVDISVVKAVGEVAKRLHLCPGSPVVVIDRIRTADGECIAFQKTYISQQMCPGIEKFDFNQVSLYEVFNKEYGITLAKAVQSLETVYITGKVAEKLEVPNKSIGLRMLRETYSDDNKPVEFVESIYRGDKYVFYFEMNN